MDEFEAQAQRPTVRSPAPGGMPSPAELSERLGSLEVLELIGRGGMGYVYKARQPALDRLVALKLLPPEAARDSSFAERFGREARALARLSHPNIVAVHDSGEIDGQYYFVMEFVDGVNLRQALHAADGRLTPEEASRVVTAVCDALEYAHDEGVVHRDIKPENILLDTRGRVKIADFGLAKLLAADGGSTAGLTLTQQTMGTPHYMAPEQTERPLEVDHRADIYSLGVVFYEMLTGELPLGRFPLPSELGRGDERVDDIVSRAMQKDPARRFQRASEIGTAVKSALGSTAARATAISPSAVVAAAEELATGVSTAARRDSKVASAITDVIPVAMRLRAPAMLLLIAGIVNLAVAWIWVFVAVIRVATDPDLTNTVGLIAPLVGFTTGWLMIGGARKMRRLESRAWAIAGSIAALIPYHLCMMPVTIPVGIWALVVNLRRDVAEAFRVAAAERAARARDTGPPGSAVGR